MAFTRWGCNFDGPWPNTDLLKPRPGLWVIWRQIGTQWKVLSVGESKNVQQSVLGDDALPQSGEGVVIHYSASYTPHLSDTARRELWSRVHRLARPLDSEPKGEP